MDSNARRFQLATHTADVAVDVYGRDIPELLVHAADALNYIVLGRADIQPKQQRSVSLTSVDDDTLLIDWLNELIYMLDAENLVFGQFEIQHTTPGYAEIQCHGEPVDPTRHRLERELKAATYHGAHINKDSAGYIARVIFDV